MPVQQRILLIEDDRRLSTLIRDYLKQQGFAVIVEDRGDRAVARILDEQPDLLLLDLMLPGKDGMTICQEVRPVYSGPILILTARDDDMDQVAGLEIGADDYVKKPVLPRVLLARIRALLRRFDRNEQVVALSDELCFGGLKILRSAHEVNLNGSIVKLTTNEFELLWLLAVNAGHVLGRNRLVEAVRGISYDGLDRSVDVAISRLRRKLGDDAGQPRRIKTIWGQGYLFVRDAW
ncbi:winged helix-turn-helix domain-containing protein [Desulfonatronum sp. SC1]|uniref:winged helix-turn-helix domain-containing protein n=1 Tax=Desulfonatronum sp. SC1 TaxID=2109626 RepID=UPI000D308D52|nr:DNA-binding response regulator [Desulfonatronum sp. SC1]